MAIIIIGAGLTGLLLNKRIHADLILEEQPTIGGVYAFDKILDKEIPYVPPILDNPLYEKFEIRYKEYDTIIHYKKYEHYKDKICKNCNELPKWITFDNMKKFYIIENLPSFLYNLAKNSRILKEYPIRIDDKRIITNKGNIIKYDKIYNTGSYKRISKLLGFKSSSLNFLSSLVMLIITRKNNVKPWNVYISGDSADSFSTIIRLDDIFDEFEIYYIYSFMSFNERKIDSDRILLDLKRRQIINPNDIIAFRVKLISEAILFGSISNEKIPYSIINCGRLGEWKNYNITEIISRIQSC
ncbi:MAG: hypothetical protein RRA45_03085 [Saccharolobus sp.]|jgi:hypothetical protein|uniref:hypothetical protein n=1 Tax=Saccharolobus sp. TaxID=2100761 RepID=UPI0028CCAC98|nr:hypothetical protein [Saccharolobus sp.]MDT7861191.1 hypothetical protein [Saccharolobus sp.]